MSSPVDVGGSKEQDPDGYCHPGLEIAEGNVLDENYISTEHVYSARQPEASASRQQHAQERIPNTM
jgi:hypothetical protein